MKQNIHRSGFSLIEIIIVVAIASSLVFVVSNLGGNVNSLNFLVSQELQSKSDVAQTLQIMATEIRSANLSASGAYPIDTAGTSSFAFYSDIDRNGTIDHVRYFLSGSTIKKGVIAPTGTPATYPTSSEIVTDLVQNVITPPTSTPLFSYYDSPYTGSQAPLSQPLTLSVIRLIKISFYADTLTNQAPTAQFFSTLVDIRNLRSN